MAISSTQLTCIIAAATINLETISNNYIQNEKRNNLEMCECKENE